MEECDQSGSCGASRTKGKLVREVEPFRWLIQGWVNVGPDYKSFHDSGHNRNYGDGSKVNWLGRVGYFGYWRDIRGFPLVRNSTATDGLVVKLCNRTGEDGSTQGAKTKPVYNQDWLQSAGDDLKH